MEGEPPKADPPKCKRRWFQFSLRSLMIFTLVCAAGSAWIGRKLEQKRRECKAVEAVRRFGGLLYYDYEAHDSLAEPSAPAWLRAAFR